MEDSINIIKSLWETKLVLEIDFIPTDSPPFILFESNVIGISMKIVKQLYMEIYLQFMKDYVKFKENTADISRLQPLYVNSLVLLTIKGDLFIAYNIRKQYLLSSLTLDILNNEIQRIHAIFTRHPKSPSGWEHLRWCLTQKLLLKASTRTNNSHIGSFTNTLNPNEVESERQLCTQSAEKYARNYYAWMHRLWLLKHFTIHQVIFDIPPTLPFSTLIYLYIYRLKMNLYLLING
jgi:hypothetical protein